MSNPEKAATPDNTSAQDSLEVRVNNAVKQMSEDDNGNIVFPDELKESLDADTLYAATIEHRRRSTQGAFTKNQQKLKSIEAEKDALLNKIATPVTFTPEEQEKLDDLKYSDPEAWRDELNKLEKSKKDEAQSKLVELTGEASKEAGAQFELARRQQVLEEFNESATVAITDELIANDVPPRITKKLEEGKITFEDFLDEVSTYLNKGKTVKNEETLDQPNLNKLSGGKTPSDAKAPKALAENYKNDIY